MVTVVQYTDYINYSQYLIHAHYLTGMDFDGLLSRVGGMGRYQLGQYAVLCASVLPIGLQTLANSFIADTVDSSCISVSRRGLIVAGAC